MTNKYIIGGVLIAAAIVAYYLWRRQRKGDQQYEMVKAEGQNDRSHEKGMAELVFLYATWCGHCRDMKADWEATKRGLEGKVKCVEIESSDPEMARFDVAGFPTIRLYPVGLERSSDDYIEYSGPREASALISFALGGRRGVGQGYDD